MFMMDTLVNWLLSGRPKGFKADGESQQMKQDMQNNENNHAAQEEDEDSKSDDDGDLFVNTNRATVQYSESDEDLDD